jgi:hypothetical protein
MAHVGHSVDAFVLVRPASGIFEPLSYGLGISSSDVNGDAGSPSEL